MKIFIAYNTNSVVNKVKSSKWFKKVESANINTEEQEKKPCCLTISPQEELLRLHTFKAINDIYKRVEIEKRGHIAGYESKFGVMIVLFGMLSCLAMFCIPIFASAILSLGAI